MDFQGDQQEYSSPRNSCLTDVMERKRGLPITLSVLLITLGSRLGFDIFGVSAPGHFLTGVLLPGEVDPVFIDPFRGPDLLSKQEAAERLAVQMSLETEQIFPFLVRAEPRQILMRMLNNLKMTYRAAGDFRKLLRVVNWLLAIQPNNMSEVRNRGLLLLRLGETEMGARDLLQYVADCPDAEDLDVIREEALRALRNRSRWN
jgi:regulator of sirC expression with transglutaminase-like and TPR domain